MLTLNDHYDCITMKSKSLKIIIAINSLLLLIPLVARQFTDEVAWPLLDFVVMGFLLLITGLLGELAIRRVPAIRYKIALCIIILCGFLLVWAELAVGIFGTPFAGN